ncbi:peptidoglycan-binding domain-containing protein [Deinococcus hopiensis]|uniref:Peptidoglycan-binding (PGRP) domain of peptidoglycan hydrolases-containing protein n=1 Tax=Deinococcus hopiensis KR-140 TaxID=695939 RepID=A0A1W1V501_9DEIO|nr:peptidoglycan-binding domain-containing protein [Deinococcus hopiensis]SMB88412.1 Peptidoglycan-binding (PGRP) domain of peptidoglycan hydrolases-containing protein [Deinococcus hopiensis KR-140]
MKFLPVLITLLLTPPALAAPGGRDVDTAATRAAQVLDGVLRNCPASFSAVGTAQKKCVGVSSSVEQARVRLGSVLGGELYGVWRSRDEQRSVYNWVKTPGGYVYLRLQPDPEGRAQTLAYLDLPPGSTAQSDTSGTPVGTAQGNGGAQTTPAPKSTPKPAPKPTPKPAATPSGSPAAQTPAPQGASAPQPTLAPVPFTRTLGVQSPRLNGADVRAVQNRLISLLRPRREGQGDGWYGPVTAKTVQDFQTANGLPATGRVNRITWNVLFSEGAKAFQARD